MSPNCRERQGERIRLPGPVLHLERNLFGREGNEEDRKAMADFHDRE